MDISEKDTGDLDKLMSGNQNRKPIRLIIITLVAILIVSAIIVIIILVSNSSKEEKMIEKLEDISDSYEKVSAKDKEYVYIPLFGTNDMHSFVFPRIVEIENTTISYKNSSLIYFGKYIEIIRGEFGEDRVLWLDGGDQHTGGVELISSKNEIMTEFMNAVKITAATMGNHEFDLDYDTFSEKINNSKFPYLAANIYDNVTHQFSPISNGTSNSNGHKKYIVKEIKLPDNEVIKIGIIGVGAKMEKTGKNAITTSGWDKFEFKEIKETIEKEVKEIKEAYPDLNAVIGAIHSGMNCNNPHKLGIYTKDQSSEYCKGELYEILSSFEKGLLDAVISGDKSYIVHDWINDIPVISTIDGGQYTNIMYLPFKKVDGKYKLIKEQVKIESPLPNCEEIFNITKICDGVESSDEYEKEGPLVKFKYRGVKMEQPNSIKDLLNKYYPEYKAYNEDQICFLKGLSNSVYGKDRSGDAYVPNLITDIIKNITKADIVIINTGALRSTWDMGKLTKAEILSMLPFEDCLCTAEITGADLKYILGIVQLGEKAYYSTSGLKQEINIKANGTKEYVNTSLWVNGENQEIDDNKTYTLGTIGFVALNYGDDFELVKEAGYEFKNVTCQNSDPSQCWNLRIIEELKKLEVIDISKYVDPNKPRLVITKEK